VLYIFIVVGEDQANLRVESYLNSAEFSPSPTSLVLHASQRFPVCIRLFSYRAWRAQGSILLFLVLYAGLCFMTMSPQTVDRSPCQRAFFHNGLTIR